MEIFGSYKLFWFVLGLAFLIMEVATPGIVFLFFGLGSWVVLLILLVAPLPVLAQWIVFLVVSVVTLLTLRRQLTRLFSKSREERADSLKEPMVAGSYLGRVVEVIGDLAPDRPGLVELNGTNWRAESAYAIPKGSMARILEVRDLTLVVEPVPSKVQP
jgi:membrane protein implicated in regulation of membrane protease activity